jgi:hypothetical protein
MKPDVLAVTPVWWNSIQWSASAPCSAIPAASGWYRPRRQSCSLSLDSMDQPICPMYTSPYSRGITQTPETVSPKSSFAVLSTWKLFLTGMW